MADTKTKSKARSEQMLIDLASKVVRDNDKGHWMLGELAAEWVERYADNRTDADFADLIGSTYDTVNKARRVHEVFSSGSAAPRNLPHVRWAHFVESYGWENPHWW